MTNVALTWQAAALIGAACIAVATVAERTAKQALQRTAETGRAGSRGHGSPPRSRLSRVLFAAAPFGREVGIILGLYALWQLAGTFTLGHVGEAVKRGHWVWDHERTWHFPSEVALQRPILGHPLLVQVCNIYYATMHFGMLLSVLLWLFIRHRDAYRRTRTLIVLTTTACLLVALVPVSPPRLINVGMVDTAAAYGQSVYANAQLGADQYSAMPSVHVAWAFLVAIAVIAATRSRWRWLILVHTAVTVYVVIVTANHFWLDGVVAVALLGISLAVQVVSRRIVLRAIASPPGVRSMNGRTPNCSLSTRTDRQPPVGGEVLVVGVGPAAAPLPAHRCECVDELSAGHRHARAIRRAHLVAAAAATATPGR